MNRKGFTFLGILTVVGIIVLLASISMPIFSRLYMSVENKKIEVELNSISTAIVMFVSDHKRYPKALNELDGYITLPDIEQRYTLNTGL